MSILVVGSVALDTIKTAFSEKIDCLGGSAVFFSMSAGYFAPVNMVAVVGEDFPKNHISFLKSRKNIDISGLEIKESGKTFRWKASYACDINNPQTLDTQLNVFAEFNPKIPEGYSRSTHLFLANIDPDLQYRVLSQIQRPRVIACDSMNYWIKTKKPSLEKLLKNVDIYFVNDSEAKLLAQTDNLMKAAKDIIKMGPEIVVIKKGEHGVLFVSKSHPSFMIPAYLLENVIDPTGAGDAFAGGFMGYLSNQPKLNSRSLRKAAVYGTIMASFAVESFSVERLGSLKKSDIEKRYKEFIKLTRV